MEDLLARRYESFLFLALSGALTFLDNLLSLFLGAADLRLTDLFSVCHAEYEADRDTHDD